MKRLLLSDYIDVYSRRQAIADGVLRDVTATAKEMGFIYPVALTAAAWADCVAVPEGCESQDEAGRLWDVLWMLRVVLQDRNVPNPVGFRVNVLAAPNRRRTVHLTAVCSGGDKAEPTITVMLTHDED